MGSTLLFVLAVVACGLMLYAVSRMEPHWVSKDGRRCICRGQQLDAHGLPSSRWREYRVEIYGDEVDVRPRSRLSRGGRSSWHVVAKSDDPPARREVFLLRSVSEPGRQMLLRLPSNSRANRELERAISS